jgi:hypothetical protein
MNNFPMTTLHLLECTACIGVRVCSADSLPKNALRADSTIICNLAKLSDPPGDSPYRHWILFHLDSERKMFIYDSLNMYLLRDDHFAFVEKNAEKIIRCNKRCQGYYSVVCGHYCVMLAHFLANKGSPDAFLDCFSSSTNANDVKVLNWVSENFGKINPRGGGQACRSFKSKKPSFPSQKPRG